jgi:hypothetical protein
MRACSTPIHYATPCHIASRLVVGNNLPRPMLSSPLSVKSLEYWPWIFSRLTAPPNMKLFPPQPNRDQSRSRSWSTCVQSQTHSMWLETDPPSKPRSHTHTTATSSTQQDTTPTGEERINSCESSCLHLTFVFTTSLF